MSNILRISFNGKQKIISKTLYQYDYGQVLKFVDLNLPAAYEVHFSNYEHGESTTVLATSNEVTIPDMYFTSGKDIYVWVYLHAGNSDGETEYQVNIPIMKRASISGEEPNIEETSIINQTIAALNAAVTESREGVQTVQRAENNVTNLYSLTEQAKDKTYQYKTETEAAVNQIKNSMQLGYITIGSTQLTEEQLIKLLQLIEE